jgi:hypothetical protein
MSPALSETYTVSFMSPTNGDELVDLVVPEKFRLHSHGSVLTLAQLLSVPPHRCSDFVTGSQVVTRRKGNQGNTTG